VSATTTLPTLRLAPPQARPDPMLQRARRLWPDSERNQIEWLRAVRVVRATARGWLLDSPVQR
jgi:hypothetical protein